MTYTPNPGMTLRAVEAIDSGQEPFTRAQVAYFIAVAYEIGRRQGLHDELAETIATWDEHATPAQVRHNRKQARLEQYERLYGPARYPGGPVDWETGAPLAAAQVAA